jgi:ethanolamine utilization protein EutP
MTEFKEGVLREGPIMAVGPVGAGKSTLLNVLALGGQVKKTEQIIYSAQSIDTPGEMSQFPLLYNSFLSSSSRASVILFLMNAKQTFRRMPPRVALAAKAPALGVVAQIDGTSEKLIERAEYDLRLMGLKKIFKVSALSGEGLDELKAFLYAHVKPVDPFG